ncbi:MAG: oligosaccharide flippase family protein [Erysipelothrix sp.]|nr:oligosaccharide flippase family protein [Erysipelothrix sp.]
MNKNKDRSNTLLLGGLTTTAGLFITKAIGILYVAPFRAMVGAENYVYYAAGYEMYDLILTISLAGLPFAVASIVSKYMAKHDYKTVMLLKKISHGLLGVLGFIGAAAVFLFINNIISTRGVITESQAIIYRNIYLIMSLSIFTVPLLSSYRGFFQGIKDFKSYSISQIVEQVSRVSFLLGFGALAIYIFDSDIIWGVYFALIATAVSAITSIIYLAVFKSGVTNEIQELANQQKSSALEVKILVSELFKFSIPFLISVILGNRLGFTQMFLLPTSLQSFGYDIATTQIYTSLLTNETLKLMSIPVVLSTGFSVAIIPQMSQALVRNDHGEIQRDISLAMESILYIGLPILCAMFFLSEEVYFALFGGSPEIIAMGGKVLKAQIIVGVLNNLMQVVNSLMMALGLRRKGIMILLIAFILNFALFPIFVTKFGWIGSSITMFLTTALVLFYSLYVVKVRFEISYKFTRRKILFMIVGLVAMTLVYYTLSILGLQVISLGRIKGLFTLAIYGGLMLVVYGIVTNILYLPQSILNVDFKEIIKKVMKK